MHQGAPFWRIYVFILLLSLFQRVEAATSSELIWLPAAQLPIGAVNVALAESNVGSVSGLPSLVFNPAGLTQLNKRELQANRATPQPSTVIEAISIALPTTYARVGVSLQQLTADDLITRDDAGNPTGVFQYTEGMLALSAARSWRYLHYGISVGALWQGAGLQKDYGTLAKVGMQWYATDAWQLGATATWAGQFKKEPNPLRYQVGVSYERGTLAWHFAGGTDTSLGVEWQPVQKLVLRAAATEVGLHWVPAAGFGFTGDYAQIDYAYNRARPGHVLSVRLCF